MQKFYKINQYITAPELRIIGPDEKQIGVMTRDEAIFKARQMGMDVILVADQAKPPVAKIIDFNKFKYQQVQKEKEGKKKTKVTGQKEVRFTPFIAQNDFSTRMEKIKAFLLEGHKVKLTVKFTGRQITKKISARISWKSRRSINWVWDPIRWTQTARQAFVDDYRPQKNS